MKNEYKKLNEVDIAESMSDSGFVLGVDENGEVKRVPKATMGKVKSVNGNQPDENGNIEIPMNSAGGVQTINGEQPDENGDVKVCEALKDVGTTGKYPVDDIIETAVILPNENNASGYFGDGEYGKVFTQKSKYDSVKVLFEDKEYICDIKESNDGAIIYVGNLFIVDSTAQNTEEPFCAYLDWNDPGVMATWKVSAIADHSRTITCQGLKIMEQTIPNRLLSFSVPNTINIPFVYDETNNTINGYGWYDIYNLIKQGYNVSFTKPATEYDPPLCLTLCGAVGNDVSEFTEGDWGGGGLVFGSLSIPFYCDYSLDPGEQIGNADSYYIKHFVWMPDALTEYTKRLSTK